MPERGSHRLEMKGRARCIGTHWRIDDVVQYLRRRPDDYDLVLEKRAIAVIRMPEFGIENLVERARLERVRRGETNHVAVKITRHVIRVTDLRRERVRKEIRKFLRPVPAVNRPVGDQSPIRRSASFSVDCIRPKIHEPDPIVLQLRRWNQHIVWRNSLRAVFEIEVRADDHFVAVTIERGVKCRITIVRRIEKQIEHHKACACRERADRATAPRLRVTTGTAARSSVEARGCPRVLQAVSGGNCNVL